MLATSAPALPKPAQSMAEHLPLQLLRVYPDVSLQGFSAYKETELLVLTLKASVLTRVGFLHCPEHTGPHCTRVWGDTGTCPYLHASHFLEPCDGVAEGVDADMAHVQLARGVREHGEQVELGLEFLGKRNKG